MSWAKSDMLALPPDLAQKTRKEIMESLSFFKYGEQYFFLVFFGNFLDSSKSYILLVKFTI
jgi:hypothetical protein